MNDEDKRIRMTKQLLQDNIMKLLREKGSVEKVSVVELCHAAEVNRSTFYRHYGSPEDVIHDIEDGILKHISELMASAEPGREGSRRAMDQVYAYLYQRSPDLRLLLENAEFGIGLLTNALHGLIEADPRGKTMDRTCKLMANTFYLHGIYAMIRDWLTAEKPMPPEQFAAYVRQIAVVL